MSLHAWEWEDEDRTSMEPISLHGLYRSLNEYDPEEFAPARAQDSDSDHRYSSAESSEERASTFDVDVPHAVPCRLVISLALPANLGNKGKISNIIDKYRRHIKQDNLKVRRFYHIEYFLLPDDGEPKKIDMLVFPMLAKVFLESGVKTVKPWRDGDKMWVSWSQTFNVNMTKELLKKINFHKITLRLWDTKDKISKKVRYYRLKATNFLDDGGSFEEVKHLVLSQKMLFELGPEEASTVHGEEGDKEHLSGKQDKEEKQARPAACEEKGQRRPRLGSQQGDPENSFKSSDENEKSFKMDDLSVFRRSASRAGATSLAGPSMVEIQELIEKTSLSSLTDMLDRQRSQNKGRDSEAKRKVQKRPKRSRVEEEVDPRLASHWSQSAFSLQLSVMPLLAGRQSVVSRGHEKSASILDCLLSLEIETPIMTEEQKQDLNPLIIRIKCASCLPTQPVPIRELEKLCTPVYCKYQFHKTPVHKTEGKPHGAHISFEDINVIFLGAMHPSDLREYLEGPPMVVEVHDRDRRSEEFSRKPTLFGEDPLDSYLNLQSLISPRDTEDNPFESQNKIWDPHGIARVSFADLLLGHKYLNLAVPIHSCEPRFSEHGPGSRRRRAMGLRAPADGHSPMPMGSYLEASSLLKLRVDIAVPLGAGAKAVDADPTGAQFGLIIFVFDFKKLLLLHGLLQDVTAINARALELDAYPTRNVQQILSAFRMRVKVQARQDLDVLTGFHLVDEKIHLLVLEGLAEQGLKRLWESHQNRVPAAERGKYKVLYNSQLLFRCRRYADLDTILFHVHLFRPVAQLMRHPALYVRNAVPRRAFQALARIHDICRSSTRLREVIVRDLLPSSAMIRDLSQEFGMPIAQEDLTEGQLLAIPLRPAPNLDSFHSQISTLNSEVLAHQEKYLKWRSTMLCKNRAKKNSLVQKNIEEVYQVIKMPPKSTATKMMRIPVPASKAVYNYSIQTLNSAELAKKELYGEMAKEPGKRFTYSQKYLSATVAPRDSEEEEKKAQKKSRQAWLTTSGFQVTGLQGSVDSQQRVRLLSLAEQEERNALFANELELELKPVRGRERWGWDLRHLDFDLYKQPPRFLELPQIPAPKPKPITGRRPKAPAPPPKQEGSGQGHSVTTSPSLLGSTPARQPDSPPPADQLHAPLSRESLSGPHHAILHFSSNWLN